MIIIFLLSIVFLLWVGVFKRIEFLSAYGFFILFSLLYNLGAYLGKYIDIVAYTLNYNSNVIDTQLFIVGLSNFAYGATYFLLYKNILYQENIAAKPIEEKRFIFFCTLIFIATFQLVQNYGWHSFTFAGELDKIGGWYTITAYVKYFFVSCYIYYIYRFGVNRGAIFLITLHTIIMLFDGGRTTYMPLLVLTLALYKEKLDKNKVKKTFIIYTCFFILVSLSVVVRALVMDSEEDLLSNILVSIGIEGVAGSYMSLQTIHAIDNGYASWFTFGTTYFIDPFAWLIPQGSLRESLLTYNAWIDEISLYLFDKFAPMGGFYYIAEAMAFIPYIGPIIITMLFAYISIYVEKNKNKYRIIYLSYFISIGILFSKTIFGNIIKLFFIQLVFLGAIIMFVRLKRIYSPRTALKKTPLRLFKL